MLRVCARVLVFAEVCAVCRFGWLLSLLIASAGLRFGCGGGLMLQICCFGVADFGFAGMSWWFDCICLLGCGVLLG